MRSNFVLGIASRFLDLIPPHGGALVIRVTSLVGLWSLENP